jgi:capsular exopolysaccharide synthesis family protein
MAKIFKGPGPAQEKIQEPAEKPHTLPARVIRSKKMGVGAHVTGPWADDYKRLHQNIISVLPDINPRILLFASVTDGEESATVVSRFGLVLAAMGEQVLLVDAHLREPILHNIFNIDQAPGTTELLSGRRSLTEVMHRFSLNGLNIIPGGTPIADSLSLQDLGELDSALDVMKAFADWIIFSCPPVNTYNDAAALAGMVHGVVLVIKAETTRWEVAQSAKTRLENAGANILGVVLNDRRHHIPEWIYKRL